MAAFLRSVLAVFVGVVVALAIIIGFDTLSSALFPLPPGVDPTDPESIREVMDQIPTAAFLILIAGGGLASLIGAWLAGRLAGRKPFVHGMIVTGLLLLAAVFNMILVPHPIWVSITGLAGHLGLGYLGARLAERSARPA